MEDTRTDGQPLAQADIAEEEQTAEPQPGLTRRQRREAEEKAQAKKNGAGKKRKKPSSKKHRRKDRHVRRDNDCLPVRPLKTKRKVRGRKVCGDTGT